MALFFSPVVLAFPLFCKPTPGGGVVPGVTLLGGPDARRSIPSWESTSGHTLLPQPGSQAME